MFNIGQRSMSTSPADSFDTPDGVLSDGVSKSPTLDQPPTNESSSAPDSPQGSRAHALRTTSDPRDGLGMTPSSTPLGSLNAARQPGPPPSLAASSRAGALPQDMLAKMRAFHLSRQGAPPAQNPRAPGVGPAQPLNVQVPPGVVPGASALGVTSASPVAPAPGFVPGMGHLGVQAHGRPHPPNWTSAPVLPGPRRVPKPSLGARRGLNLPGGLPGALPNAAPGGGQVGSLSTSNPTSGADTVQGSTMNNKVADGVSSSGSVETGSLFNKFSNYVDTKTGTLRFAGKAVIHGKGVDFSSGSSFSISLDEVDMLEELGKGNYGTVYKVRHSRPQIRRPGLGLKGNRPQLPVPATSTATSLPTGATEDGDDAKDGAENGLSDSGKPVQSEGTTGAVMAMKEIRLELDEAKFAAIIMELDILHRCISPFIVDFYGAFFQEGAVYICMEYMDGGSVDKLYGDGIPENVLRKIALSTVMGLKTLKDEHNIIHRDVKPTNILINTKGQVKICDFGVSGNLVASIAKTNIGCQSYMAPERIATGGVAQAGANPGGGTYSVQSDIWSLALTIIECAMGRYPYAPETYNNIFSQLSVCQQTHLWLGIC